MCFETNSEKDSKVPTPCGAGQGRSELITLQVGSRGVPDLPGFENLAASLSLPHKDRVRLLESTASLALAGSFGIWCARNKPL